MAQLTPEELSSKIDQHGGYVGVEPVKSDATIPNPKFPKISKLDQPNPNQAMKYTLRDGTYFTVSFDPTAGPDGGWNVVDGGTALKDTGTAAKAPKIVKMPDGSLASENPDGTLTPQTGAAPPKEPTPKNTVPGSGTPGTVDYSSTSAGGSDTSGPSVTGGTPDVPVDTFRALTERQIAERQAAQDKANNDRNAANDAYGRGKDAAAAARQAANDAWNQQHQTIQDQLAQGRLTLDQAIQAANEAHQKISEQLQMASRSYTTAGQFNNVQSLIGQAAQGAGMSYTPSQPTPLGYDPAEVGKRIAQQVMSQPAPQQQLGPQFSMAGS